MIFKPLHDDSDDDSPHQASSCASCINGRDFIELSLVTTESSVVEPVTEPIAKEPIIKKTVDSGAEDQKVITLLFEKYNSKICAYLTHIVGSDEVGRDLAQETFIKAWQALPSLRSPSHSEAWLFRIARNKAIDYLRRKKIQKILLPWTAIEQYEAAGHLNTGGFEDHISEMECVKQALAQVRPKFRECLILYVIVGLSQRRIAEIIGIDEKSVSTYVSLGRKEFRQAYEHLKGENI